MYIYELFVSGQYGMKLLKTLYLFLFFNVNTIIAQQSKVQSLHHFDVFLFGAGYSYEQVFGSKFTISPSLSLISSAYSFYISEHQNGSMVARFHPSLSLDSRLYTNINKRVKRGNRGKNVENNSANFVSLLVEYISGNPIAGNSVRQETFAITPRGGFRSSFNQHFFMEFAIGLPYIIDKIQPNPYVGLHLGLKAGFGFGKK